MSKEIIFNKQSTNGRYGITIVGVIDDIDNVNYKPSFCRGYLIDHGNVGKMKTFEVVRDDTSDEIIIWGGDIEAIDSCVEFYSIYLQSSNSATILIGRYSNCSFVEYGHKRRSSRVYLIGEGKYIDIPSQLMKVLGFLPGTTERVKVDIPPPDDRIAQAFKKAGL